MGNDQEPEKVSRWFGYLQYSSIGLEMGLSMGVGAAIGYWLDKELGTEPWMLALWAFAGLVAGFRSLFRLAKKYMDESKNEKNE